jgi:hypothetical protein
MAITTTKDQGKTAFVKQVLFDNPFANPKAVNEAWQESGREGSISETLVNKMRSEMGLTGNLRGKRSPNTASASSEPKRSGQKRERKPKQTMAPVETGETKSEGSRRGAGNRQGQLVELEADIDRILFKVMGMGHFPEIEESLRKTRRLLYQSSSKKRS